MTLATLTAASVLSNLLFAALLVSTRVELSAVREFWRGDTNDVRDELSALRGEVRRLGTERRRTQGDAAHAEMESAQKEEAAAALSERVFELEQAERRRMQGPSPEPEPEPDPRTRPGQQLPVHVCTSGPRGTTSDGDWDPVWCDDPTFSACHDACPHHGRRLRDEDDGDAMVHHGRPLQIIGAPCADSSTHCAVLMTAGYACTDASMASECLATCALCDGHRRAQIEPEPEPELDGPIIIRPPHSHPVCGAGIFNDCDPNYATCRSLGPGGGHECICVSGWSGDGHTCYDDNECDNYPCPGDQDCVESGCAPSSFSNPVECQAGSKGDARPAPGSYNCVVREDLCPDVQPYGRGTCGVLRRARRGLHNRRPAHVQFRMR